MQDEARQAIHAALPGGSQDQFFFDIAFSGFREVPLLKTAQSHAEPTRPKGQRARPTPDRPLPPGSIKVIAIPARSVASQSRAKETAREVENDSETHPQAESGPVKTEISQELQRILTSKTFAKAFRLRSLLNWIVNEWLEGREDKIDAYTIALAVFSRDRSFDPGIDPIVRVEISRLRRRLEKYYSGEGLDCQLRIDLPSRTYIPRVCRQSLRDSAFANSLHWEPGAIMIVPFDNDGRGERSSRISRDIYDYLIWLLTEEGMVRVLSRIAAALLGHTLEIPRLRKELGVDFIIEGAFSQDGDGSHLILHMTETTAGYNVWSGHYALTNAPLVNLCRQIVADLVSRMRETYSHGLSATANRSCSGAPL